MASIDQPTSRDKLIRILQLAYSGELAAAYAYRGHWHSLSDPQERAQVKQIEEEEWHHRRLVGEMLAGLNAGPNKRRELRATLVGRTLGLLCHVTGWFAPMYGAGRLERSNIREYEMAAQFARESNHDEMVDCLLTMAEVEWEHERYFREKIAGHFLLRIFRVWEPPPPKESIRKP